jgi:hypothetical protein
MATTTTGSSVFTLALNEEEREQLLSFLEQALRDKQVEVHRTDALEYRKYVQHQEALLQGLIDKLRRP